MVDYGPSAFRRSFVFAVLQYAGAYTYLSDAVQMAKTHDARIAADDVKLAEMLDGVIHQLHSLRELPDVGLEGNGVGSPGL